MTKLILTAFIISSFTHFAHAGKTYQVTGPVVEVTDTKIVVLKGKEKWELARTPGSKITGDLKVGSKVTIDYSMTAENIEVKAEKTAPKAKK